MKEDVINALKNKRRCLTPEVHAEYQPPKQFGRLTVAESLDPADVLYYEVCGLCVGMLTEFE